MSDIVITRELIDGLKAELVAHTNFVGPSTQNQLNQMHKEMAEKQGGLAMLANAISPPLGLQPAKREELKKKLAPVFAKVGEALEAIREDKVKMAELLKVVEPDYLNGFEWELAEVKIDAAMFGKDTYLYFNRDGTTERPSDLIKRLEKDVYDTNPGEAGKLQARARLDAIDAIVQTVMKEHFPDLKIDRGMGSRG